MTIHSSVSIGISNAFIIYFFSCGGIIAFELLHGRETYGIVWKRMGTYGNVRLPNRHVVSLHQIPKRGKTYRRSFRPVTDVLRTMSRLLQSRSARRETRVENDFTEMGGKRKCFRKRSLTYCYKNVSDILTESG